MATIHLKFGVRLEHAGLIEPGDELAWPTHLVFYGDGVDRPARLEGQQG
jgi:hypothetical protein